jgi:O-antigen/teichoic acid export membrane protein
VTADDVPSNLSCLGAPIGPIMRFAVPQAGVALLSIQSLGLSILLLGYFGSNRTVGIFAVALSLQGAVGVFLTGVLSIWAPLVVDLYERGEIARLQSLYQTITRWTVTFAFPVYTVLIIAPEAPLRLLTGAVDPEAVTITAVLAVGNLFFVGSGPCSYLISMTGRAGVNLANSVAAVVLYLALGIWAVPRYGAIGMAVVDAGVTVVVNSIRVFQGKVLIGVHPFGRSFLKPLSAAAAMALALLAWGAVAPNDLVVQLAGLAVAGAVYVGVLWVRGIDPEERYVYDRIRRRLRWKPR